MKSRNIVASLILIIALVVFAMVKWHLWEPQRKEAFNRHPSHLVYTHHAMCRMDCRHISESDITEIMKTGIILFNRSNMYDRPCPSFALQGLTSDHENLRVIFAQCDDVTKVVTCYNLHREYECHCPGDEEGSRNSPLKKRN
jgi:hypothetical protein